MHATAGQGQRVGAQEERGLEEREMPLARRGMETLHQEQPETGNQYLEDALLRSYLRAHLPPKVEFGSVCPCQTPAAPDCGGTIARSPSVPPSLSLGGVISVPSSSLSWGQRRGEKYCPGAHRKGSGSGGSVAGLAVAAGGLFCQCGRVLSAHPEREIQRKGRS